MFKFLTELLRRDSKSDETSGNRSPALRERPEQRSTRAAGEGFRPRLEVLEQRIVPGGGSWSG